MLLFCISCYQLASRSCINEDSSDLIKVTSREGISKAGLVAATLGWGGGSVPSMLAAHNNFADVRGVANSSKQK